MNERERGGLRDYAIATVIAVGVAYLIRGFGIEAYRIPSDSMRPTLEPGDTLFVAKWPYGLRLPWNPDQKLTAGHPPHPGDVVVFSHPEDAIKDYIKRVVAVPGDRIQVKKGEVFLNGKNTVMSREVAGGLCGEEQVTMHRYRVCWEPPLIEDFGPAVVPPGQVFVIGDLRQKQPLDARRQLTHGLIPIDSIKGQAMWVWLSVEPGRPEERSGWFSRIRFERMFETIR